VPAEEKSMTTDEFMPVEFDDYDLGDDDGGYIDDYDITATPNDFNVKTIFDFMSRGSIRIPVFQRNYIWDRPRASRLIESLLIGLPVPQVFLYEDKRNQFLVIDGQQRLMTIYYFFKKRFPRQDKRVELRREFDVRGGISEDLLTDNNFFMPFDLYLREYSPNSKNPFDGLNIETLDGYRERFELRTIRMIIVKQNSPKEDDDSSIYEIFSRLNTGGINLSPQEIRASLFHSPFYDILGKMNEMELWRSLVGNAQPDIRQKDIEVLLRGFALLIKADDYSPSMVRFLNMFSRSSRKFGKDKIEYLKTLFVSFLGACSHLPHGMFRRRGRFNIALFETVFVSVCLEAFKNQTMIAGKVALESIVALETDFEFKAASQYGTTSYPNVQTRLERGQAIIKLNLDGEEATNG